ncbi:hypothetical protein M134_3974 [Bacteroides fragilis str. S24L34]|nr:hypothetical protein M134_3974 [Bacteroides fragilis str. S24L34]
MAQPKETFRLSAERKHSTDRRNNSFIRSCKAVAFMTVIRFLSHEWNTILQRTAFPMFLLFSP